MDPGGDIHSNYVQRPEPCGSVGRVPHGFGNKFCSKFQINPKTVKVYSNKGLLIFLTLIVRKTICRDFLQRRVSVSFLTLTSAFLY